MARQYSRELWARVKGLFISGCSVRDIARQCGIPAGSVAARCARERWANERNGVIETKDKIDANGHDSHSEAVAAVVLENKIATLIAESRSARLLAEKALAAVEHLSINGFEEIREAQGFRQNLWPAVAPQSSEPIENKTTLILHFAHEWDKIAEGREPALRLTLDGKPTAPEDPPGGTPPEKPKEP
jgi:hypothetical protein